MKIILQAFGGTLRSQPMEVPEKTGNLFRMRLFQPPTVVADYAGKEAMRYPPFGVECTFVNRNRYLPLTTSDGKFQSAAIYELEDITKYED
ncbi:MAG: hypothetical protein PHI33_09225 [Smithellaceae bacterium]|nr:hypothetical protein [Smithellaceae bacterium]